MIRSVELQRQLQPLGVNTRQAAKLLKALANEQRLKIFEALAQEELSVGALNQRVDLSQSALSQHLAVLRRDGLIRSRRASQTIYYKALDGSALKLLASLHEIFGGNRRRKKA